MVDKTISQNKKKNQSFPSYFLCIQTSNCTVQYKTTPNQTLPIFNPKFSHYLILRSKEKEKWKWFLKQRANLSMSLQSPHKTFKNTNCIKKRTTTINLRTHFTVSNAIGSCPWLRKERLNERPHLQIHILLKSWGITLVDTFLYIL